jgi:hypothetical protein
MHLTSTTKTSRVLLDGEEVKVHEDIVDLSIHTRVPEKWILIDMETGQVYRGSDNQEKYKRWILQEHMDMLK